MPDESLAAEMTAAHYLLAVNPAAAAEQLRRIGQETAPALKVSQSSGLPDS